MGQQAFESNENDGVITPEKLDPVRVICSCGYRFIEDDPAKWLDCPNCERLNPIRQTSEWRKTEWIRAQKAKANDKV